MHAIQLMRRALCRMGQRSLATGWQSWVHYRQFAAGRTHDHRALFALLLAWTDGPMLDHLGKRQSELQDKKACGKMLTANGCTGATVQRGLSGASGGGAPVDPCFRPRSHLAAWARWAVLVMSPADRSLMNHAARVFTHRFLAATTWAEVTQRQRRKLAPADGCKRVDGISAQGGVAVVARDGR